MVKIYRNLSEDQANLCSLILSAMGIRGVFTKNSSRLWDVFVEREDYLRSLHAVRDYHLENRESHKEEHFHEIGRWDLFSALLGILVLEAFFYAVNVRGLKDQVFRVYGASAYKIMHGEVYRAATALVLHGDLVHLAGNVAALAVFVPVVLSYTGAGAGWFLILFSGISGNLINAAFYRYAHLSVGASTAVFGAVGILTACRTLERHRATSSRTKSWVHVGGGVALLRSWGRRREMWM